MATEKEVVCETTVCDGSKDVVNVIIDDIQTDFAAVAGKYGKYAVYAVAGFIGFNLFKRFRKRRRGR